MGMKLGKSEIAGYTAKARDFLHNFKLKIDDISKITDTRQKELNHGLLKAAMKGKNEELKLLLKVGADIHAKDSHGRTALIFAASEGKTGTAMLITEEMGDRSYVDMADELGRTALIYAAAHGHIGICVILLKKGANMAAKDDQGKTALVYATANGHAGVADMLNCIELMDQSERMAYLANLMRCGARRTASGQAPERVAF